MIRSKYHTNTTLPPAGQVVNPVYQTKTLQKEIEEYKELPVDTEEMFSPQPTLPPKKGVNAT